MVTFLYHFKLERRTILNLKHPVTQLQFWQDIIERIWARFDRLPSVAWGLERGAAGCFTWNNAYLSVNVWIHWTVVRSLFCEHCEQVANTSHVRTSTSFFEAFALCEHEEHHTTYKGIKIYIGRKEESARREVRREYLFSHKLFAFFSKLVFADLKHWID